MMMMMMGSNAKVISNPGTFCALPTRLQEFELNQYYVGGRSVMRIFFYGTPAATYACNCTDTAEQSQSLERLSYGALLSLSLIRNNTSDWLISTQFAPLAL